MKEFLENLEIGEGKVKLSSEEIKNILKEHGKVVTNEKEKIETTKNTEIDNYKTTITNLETKMKDAPDSKQLEDLKKEIADMKTAEEKRIADEKARQEDETLTNNIVSVFGDKKFTSDYVKNGLIADIKSELKKSENVGKGIKDIFDGLTKDKTGIFENPNQPASMPGMGDNNNNNPNSADGFVSIIQEAQRN